MQRAGWLVVLLCASWANAQDASPGAIAGTIRFTGPVPAPQKILTSDGAVLHHSDLVVDPKTKGLRYVAAYLDGAPAQPLAKGANTVVVDQRDMIFLPRVVTAHEGQTVRFDNNDLCNHAVQAIGAKAENAFNVTTPMNQPFDFRFKAEKGPVQIGCPIHTWMRAWVYVLPHPWHAVTGADGQFRIERIPPGKHKVAVVHPDTGLRETRVVEIEGGRTTRLEITWDAVKK
jgi:plastocyanin